MYTSRNWALAAEAAQWLAQNDAPDQAAADYLRDAYPDLIDRTRTTSRVRPARSGVDSPPGARRR